MPAPVNPTPPAELPRWAETVGNVPTSNIIDPPSNKKDVGWANVEEPPAPFLNWWMNLVYLWVVYVQAFVAYILAAPPTAWLAVNAVMWDGGGGAPAVGFLEANGGLLTAGATTSKIAVAMDTIRQGTTVTSVDVRVNEVAGQGQFKLWKQQGLNTPGGAPTMTQIGATVTTAAVAGRKTVNLPVSPSLTVNNDTALIWEWIPHNVGDQIEAYRIN